MRNSFFRIPTIIQKAEKKRNSVCFSGSLLYALKILSTRIQNHRTQWKNVQAAALVKSAQSFYLMQDNPCPNTSLLLFTGELRMKEKVMLLLLLC